MRKTKQKEDKMIDGFDSALMEEVSFGFDNPIKEMAISGNLDVGKGGHPVTVVIEDEITGEMLEINHVDSAFLMIEDRRKRSAGWLAVVVGNVEKINRVLGFLSKLTLNSLKKMAKKK